MTNQPRTSPLALDCRLERVSTVGTAAAMPEPCVSSPNRGGGPDHPSSALPELSTGTRTVAGSSLGSRCPANKARTPRDWPISSPVN
jgi:hypothetical protein